MVPISAHPPAQPLKKRLFLGNTRRILKNPVQFLGTLPQSYGPVVTVNFVGKKYFVLQHPDYIKHVLLDNHKGYSKPGATKILRDFLGDGLITSNGEEWYKKRRLLQPAFHKQRLSHILSIINEETSLFIDKLNHLPQGSKLNISDELLELNISIVSRAMFSSGIKEEMVSMMNALAELSDFASSWMKSIIKVPVQWPTAANMKFKENAKIFDSIIHAMIERRINYRSDVSLPCHDDLLDMLLDYVDEDTNAVMSKRMLRDEVTTIFMAGHETTAQTLGWIFYHIAREKGISNTLCNEATNVLTDNQVSLEHLSQLIYTKQVIHEGMRCYPSVSALVRKPYQDDLIKGIKIPALSNVLINIYGMHHHPKYWESPNEFNPEHFNSKFEKQRAPFVFLPFGGGPRLCIGNSFAMMVMQVVVSRLFKEFEFAIPEGYSPQIEPNITIRARGGIQLLIRKLD